MTTKQVPDLITDNIDKFKTCITSSDVRSVIDDYFSNVLFSIEKNEWLDMTEFQKNEFTKNVFNAYSKEY